MKIGLPAHNDSPIPRLGMNAWIPDSVTDKERDNFWGINREIKPIRFYIGVKKKSLFMKIKLSISAFIETWKWN